MALSKEVYQVLEDIVGSENISDEPAILDSYSFQYRAELSQPGHSQFTPRADAVLLPGSVEEVQAIVKACNQYKLKYKPQATSWGPYGMPMIEGVITLDMSRMNRILEIDEQNKIAVVEPYVSGGRLQAEAMKVGLNCHMIGAGANTSVLAAASTYMGMGPDSIYLGHAAENLLALEWVLPTGEILRTGSLGSGAGWFCGDGPGPSVRGVIRGWYGTSGGLGVVTKCAIRLHPWPGPAIIPVEGTIPAYMSPVPENFRVYTVAVPTWQAYADTLNKIFDAEIGYIGHRQYILWGSDLQAPFLKIYTDPAKTIDHLEEMLEKPEVKKMTEEMRISVQLILAGMSLRDIEYQDKALMELLAETGGWIVEEMSDPVMQKFTFLYMVRLPSKNLNFVWGTYGNSFGQRGTPDYVISMNEVYQQLKKKHIKQGGLIDDGGDAQMGTISDIGGGGAPHLEGFVHYDQTDPESIEAAKAYVKESVTVSIAHGWYPGYAGVAGYGGTDKPLEEIPGFKVQSIAYSWQTKIKDAFDPNDTGDGSYVTGKRD